MDNLNFTKMQGTGNDFIIINNLANKIDDFADIAKKMCHRKFGVGADQFIVLEHSTNADFYMKIYNADGSQAEMCGNAIRALALYIQMKKISDKSQLNIETLSGIVSAEILDEKNVKVDMGTPISNLEKIGVTLSGSNINREIILSKDFRMNFTFISMGNPHAVTFVDNVDLVDIETLGSQIENHEIFTNKTNVEFIEIISKSEIKMRVWERGAGETLSCGSGACAAAVSAIFNKLTNSSMTIQVRGGQLMAHWDETLKKIHLQGPAEWVFEGSFNIQNIL